MNQNLDENMIMKWKIAIVILLNLLKLSKLSDLRYEKNKLKRRDSIEKRNNKWSLKK